MEKNQEKLFNYLESLGIQTLTTEHEGVHTVGDNQRIRMSLDARHQNAAHIKNLFLKDKKGKLWLIIAREDCPIDLKQLRHKIGAAHLSFGKPDLLQAVLGVTPGSVTPLALINDRDHQINVVIEQDLSEARAINCHPLSNDATTLISVSDLMLFMEKLGFSPQICQL